MRELQPIIKQFLTYNTKSDPSNADQRFLATPSKNVLISDIEKLASRQGFTLQSPAGTGGPIKASTEWGDSSGNDRALRAYFTDPTVLTTGVLEVLINSNWETLMDTLSSINFIFDPYYDTTEKIDRLLFCDGTPSQYDWSGAVATLSSITVATVKCLGTSTFGQQRFLTTGTRTIRIKDDNGVWRETTYTGGEGTTTLTGLGSDLSAFPFSGGNLIVQKVITRATTPDSTFNTDALKVINNQVWNISRTSNRVYVSKDTDVTSYTFSTPRAIGEGAMLVLDGPGRAVNVLKGDVILFSGKNYVYKSSFNQITVGGSLAETLKVVRLKTTPLQSALHQNLCAAIDDGLVWIGYDNIFHKLVDATLAYNPALHDESDPIKPDFDATDFTGGHIFVLKNRIHISAPASTTNFIREYRFTDAGAKQWFWQPPQSYAVNRYAIISSVLHGHSSATSETYKLFDSYSDNGKAIATKARLARWNGGVREMLKKADEMFNEGALAANTTIKVTYFFDLDGGDFEVINRIISGTYSQILFPNAQDPSLGNDPLGDDSLSGDVTGANTLPHFRVIDDLNPTEFFDYAVQFETNDIDYRWEWMAHGSNSTLSRNIPTEIKNNN